MKRSIRERIWGSTYPELTHIPDGWRKVTLAFAVFPLSLLLVVFGLFALGAHENFGKKIGEHLFIPAIFFVLLFGLNLVLCGFVENTIRQRRHEKTFIFFFARSFSETSHYLLAQAINLTYVAVFTFGGYLLFLWFLKELWRG